VREERNATPRGVAFLRSRPLSRPAFLRPEQTLPGFPTFVTKDDSAHGRHLQEVGLLCSIGVAYQAADAGHPDMGLSKLAAEQVNFAPQ
jgi:hypothetical protein